VDKIVLGMSIGLVAVAIFFTLAVAQVGLIETIIDRVPGNSDDNNSNNNIISINSVDSCVQRFYIPTTPGGRFHSCPAIVTSSAAITNIGGFPACVQMYGGGPSSHPATYDFVLRPNSTGYITVVYDFGQNELPSPGSFSNPAKSSGIHRLSGDGSSWIFLPANQTSLTASVAPENVTSIYPSTLKVTYTIETRDTRQEEVGNTYLFNIFQVCTGELITIGDKPYTGKLPLD
jgi:hypothetical protein